MKKPNRYTKIIEHIFFSHYRDGDTEVDFEREEIRLIAEKLGIELPLNLGDVIYSFRYRASFPESIKAKAPKGTVWIIRTRVVTTHRLPPAERSGGPCPPYSTFFRVQPLAGGLRVPYWLWVSFAGVLNLRSGG